MLRVINLGRIRIRNWNRSDILEIVTCSSCVRLGASNVGISIYSTVVVL